MNKVNLNSISGVFILPVSKNLNSKTYFYVLFNRIESKTPELTRKNDNKNILSHTFQVNNVTKIPHTLTHYVAI